MYLKLHHNFAKISKHRRSIPFLNSETHIIAHSSRMATATTKSKPNGNGKKPKEKKNYDYVCGEPKTEAFPYWNVQKISEGLADGSILKGALRINVKNYKQCFIPHTSGFMDVYIPWRNRSFNSDVVAVKLMEREKWRVLISDIQDELFTAGKITDKLLNSPKRGGNISAHLDYPRLHEFNTHEQYQSIRELILQQYDGSELSDKFIQPTGAIVGIIEEVNTRLASGQLKPNGGSTDRQTALFIPRDSRIPRVNIPIKSCPKDFTSRPQDFSEILFVVKIDKWLPGCVNAAGSIVKSLGSVSEIEPLTLAVLIEHGVDYDPFVSQVEACLPQNLPWRIPAEEIKTRRDFRRECVFTIDPATARDLDDALSCKQLDDDTYEIGVHIADVSYFINNRSALDDVARSRATSVYMVQKVIPMLPRLLCEELCSLNPDSDRLTFSVVWHVDSEGNITDEWFGRSVIKSCCKLSYQHAQGMIESADRKWSCDELPPISDGFNPDDISSRVLVLNKIARILRKKRFDNGALRLDQTKLMYILNQQSQYPTGYSIYQQKDSNKMIEEFMLLANMAVARKIYRHFPKISVLRCHPEPQGKQLQDLESMCQNLGLQIDASTSHSLHESLIPYREGKTDRDAAIFQLLMQLCMKPMQLAKYFCTGSLPNETQFRHYALSVPFYTHFTSPIRRYADVMVHRLLAASLGYCAAPPEGTDDVEAQAKHCNQKKDNAKKAGELSTQIFFSAFLKACGPIVEKAMVLAVLDRSVDVVLVKLGHKKRAYTDKLNLAADPKFNANSIPQQLILSWNPDSPTDDPEVQTIKPLDIIYVKCETGKDLTQFMVNLMSPSEVSAHESNPPPEYNPDIDIELDNDEDS